MKTTDPPFMSKAGFLLFYLLFMHVLSHCTVQIADPHNIHYIHVEFLSHAARVLCPCVQVGKDRIIMYHSHTELYTPTDKARLEMYTNKKISPFFSPKHHKITAMPTKNRSRN
jgi:hypothetical protein